MWAVSGCIAPELTSAKRSSRSPAALATFSSCLRCSSPPLMQGQCMRRLAPCILALIGTVAAAPAARRIRSVSVDVTSMNPSAGDGVILRVDFASAGRATITVVDRDGYRVRSLAAGQSVIGGATTFLWDGRDANGSVVADEAYSF